MEIRGLLHEKIQLYIYKPSINKDDQFMPNRLAPRPSHCTTGSIGLTKINSPYYGEFTESLSQYYLTSALRKLLTVLQHLSFQVENDLLSNILRLIPNPFQLADDRKQP